MLHQTQVGTGKRGVLEINHNSGEMTAAERHPHLLSPARRPNASHKSGSVISFINELRMSSDASGFTLSAQSPTTSPQPVSGFVTMAMPAAMASSKLIGKFSTDDRKTKIRDVS